MSDETKTPKTEVEKTTTQVALSENNTVTVELFPQKKRGSKDVYLSRAILRIMCVTLENLIPRSSAPLSQSPNSPRRLWPCLCLQIL